MSHRTSEISKLLLLTFCQIEYLLWHSKCDFSHPFYFLEHENIESRWHEPSTDGRITCVFFIHLQRDIYSTTNCSIVGFNNLNKFPFRSSTKFAFLCSFLYYRIFSFTFVVQKSFYPTHSCL